MLNNQIVITDRNVCPRAVRNDAGVVDANELTGDEWTRLRERNVNSPKAKLVQCAKCWELYREVQWMRTYSTSRGTRVVSHQPGESRLDHDYEPVETAEHRAFNDRAFTIGDAEGYNPRREAWAPNMKTRADVLLTGTLTIAYEHQHSPFSATGRYSAPERTRLAAAVGRTAMWHSTSDKVRGQVPILRTDGGLPPKVIANPNYRHEFRGGIYRIEIYTCTVRNGYECPNGKFSGCGKPHARGQVTAGQLDDVLRGAPVGAYMPVMDAQVLRAPRFFWTDMASYGQYLAYIASPSVVQLDGPMAGNARARNGRSGGHSRAKEAELEAMRTQAVDLSALPREAVPAARLVAPAIPRPIQRVCDTGRPMCGGPARLYPAGWRCDDHRPSSYWRSQEQQPRKPGEGAR
ncbi:hypothetical protein [Streptomyces sp. NPDC047990]|uniref:hypothetical protein n=1 Tax=Streptomyces sp. NPDC047990 TaxID=3365496 RepID=UPI00371F3B10